MINLSDLTIIVPTAGYSNVARSLYTFRKYAEGAKIIVVDQTPNGALSSDEIKKYTDIYVKANKALGFSKAMNFGIALSDSEVVCCVNDDVEFVHNRMWEGIGSWMDRDDVAAVNPASVKGYNHESDNLGCSCNGEIDESNGNCLECRAYKEEYTDEDWGHLTSKRKLVLSAINPIAPEMCVDGIMTWCMFIHREALDRIKNNDCYFDEKFYPGGAEDYDLMCRLYDGKESGRRYRAVGIFNSWAYHHWFGTKVNRSHEQFMSTGENKPEIYASLRYNDVDGKYNRKLGDPLIIKDGKQRESNWDLWGRINKDIPCPPCTKYKL